MLPSVIYRRLGADPPFGDPTRAHGGRFEGWFWRWSRDAGVIVVIAAICRAADGSRWGMACVGHEHGTVHWGTSRDVAASGHALRIGTLLRASRGALSVDLEPERLDLDWVDPVRMPRRAWGALGAAQAVPGLSQYWAPHVLHADVPGGSLYSESNWGRGGMPDRWWWGQAHGFDDDPRICVAFAGGPAGLGRLRVDGTALVVSTPAGVRRWVRPPGRLRVSAREDEWRLDAPGVVLEGGAAGAPPVGLPVPVPGAAPETVLDARSPQHLRATVTVTVRRRGRAVWRGTSHVAGLEVGRGG